jgi:glycosyltransferase involved in cell wall biosynthesis
MSISIVTRSLRTSELQGLIDNLMLIDNTEIEIIAVCVEEDVIINEIEKVRIIIENSNRFRARITGIRNASFENVLLLDCDQRVTKELLRELDKKKEDIVIIPERSSRQDIVRVMFDDLRKKTEAVSVGSPSPDFPVVPRFYKRDVLMKGLADISDYIAEYGLSHEDSILFYEVYRYSKSIAFSKENIIDLDPDLFTIIRKAFLYGQYARLARKAKLPQKYLRLIGELNKNSLLIKKHELGPAHVLQGLRAIAYGLGFLVWNE